VDAALEFGRKLVNLGDRVGIGNFQFFEVIDTNVRDNLHQPLEMIEDDKRVGNVELGFWIVQSRPIGHPHPRLESPDCVV
jgi:hypothetical protein